MTTGVRRAVRRSGGERPDSEYALVAGLYVAALVVPAAVATLARAVADAAGLYVGFLGVVAGWPVSSGGPSSAHPDSRSVSADTTPRGSSSRFPSAG